MARILGLLAVGAALVVCSIAPASAEFFGCNEPRSKVSYSSSNYRGHYAQASGHYAQASAPRQQRTTSQSSHRRAASQWR